MDIVRIAYKGDMKVFKEFLDLGIVSPTERDIIRIFKNATYQIQQELYNKYGNIVWVHCSAILNASKDVKLNVLEFKKEIEVDKITCQEILKSGYIKIDTTVLMCLRRELIGILDDTMICGNIVTTASVPQIAYLLDNNPKLSKYYSHVFDDSCLGYNYEGLSKLIVHGIVIFPASINISTVFTNTLMRLRKYIPDWTCPSSINYNHEDMDILTLDESVRLGMYPPDKVDLDISMNKNMVVRNLQYLGSRTLIIAYLMYGIESALSYSEPVEMAIYISGNEKLRRIHALGRDYIEKLTIHSLPQFIMTEEVMVLYNDIVNWCQGHHWKQCYTPGESILLHNYIDKFESSEIDWSVVEPLNISCKKGIALLWKKHYMEPLCVKLFCQYLPNSIATLDPPIPFAYHRFLDREILDRINHIRKNVLFHDISFKFQD